MATRRKPFSAKQKKLQLQAKRQAKQARAAGGDLPPPRRGGAHHDDDLGSSADEEVANDAAATVQQGSGDARATDRRKQPDLPASLKLRSVFEKEPKEVIEKRIAESRKPYRHLAPSEAFEVELTDFYGPDAVIDIPKRPPWRYGQSKAEVEGQEAAMFREWLQSVYDRYPVERLSFFEHNLEVWRQLWRVAEMSDIVLLIVDIRFPLVHFPPALYNYIVRDMKRHLVLVLNKIDLVSADVVRAWTEYFRAKFPQLHVATFSCYPAEVFEFNDLGDEAKLRARTAAHRRRYHRAVGVRDVLNACRQVPLTKHNVQVDWAALIERYSKEALAAPSAAEGVSDAEDSDEEAATDAAAAEANDDKDDRSAPFQQAHPHPDLITIGLVGHPNVGKSSLINGLLGKKVVSASRTPGHTKHFQTIHLTENVRVADCPGLVFPSLLPKPLQILAGVYNIAQVNEPYSVVQYLAERVPLPEMLDLVHPSLVQDWQGDAPRGPMKSNAELRKLPHPPWTAWEICEVASPKPWLAAFAIKKGFYTARAGRPDAYRAANMILRLAADGRILYSQKPRGFYGKQAAHTTAAAELERCAIYPLPGAPAAPAAGTTPSSERLRAIMDEDDDEAASGRGEESDDECDAGDSDTDDSTPALAAATNAFAALQADEE